MKGHLELSPPLVLEPAFAGQLREKQPWTHG
jgi:hypothetical protein